MAEADERRPPTQQNLESSLPSLPSTTSPRGLPQPADTEPEDAERIAIAVAETATAFARAPLTRKLAALAEVRARLRARGHELARLGAKAKGLARRPAGFAEELLAGAVVIQRYVRLLSESLSQIKERGAPHLSDERAHRLPSGEVSVRVMPHSFTDRLLFAPYHVEVRLAATVDAAHLRSAQAGFYQRSDADGEVAVVLGAGNVASIPALDVLHQCFVEGRACVLKMSQVNGYLGPLFEHVFAPVSELGGLRIVYGGSDVGRALVASSAVDHVHMTGSIETHDAVVWGPSGAEREQRRLAGSPLLKKSITSELGNISPVVVVPGPYTERELDDVAASVSGMLFNNASFNCNAAKLLVLPKSLAEPLVARLRRAFEAEPARDAYYPGAIERYHELIERGEGKVWQARASEGQLPWTLLTELSPSSNARPFQREPFCPLLSVVEVDEDEASPFLVRAVSFLNDRVWGTLSAMLFVPSGLEADHATLAAVDRAIDQLRYGTVAVNYWPALGYGLGTPPWGGHPSATLADAQSGLGFVHNSLMLEQVQKVVLRGPLRSFPKPFYYPSHRTLDGVARGLFELESTGRLLPLLRAALSGARA